MSKVKVKKNKQNKKEVIPKKKSNKVLAIMLKDNKAINWIWISRKKSEFNYNEGTYFIDPNGQYLSDNGILCSVYLEGISTPFSHEHIEYETIKKDIVIGQDEKGESIIKTMTLNLIKGLKWDAKLLNMLLTRKLADVFTRRSIDLPNLIIMLLLIGTIIVGIANLGVQLS